jgi:hypothetical protein
VHDADGNIRVVSDEVAMADAAVRQPSLLQLAPPGDEGIVCSPDGVLTPKPRDESAELRERDAEIVRLWPGAPDGDDLA